MAKFSVTPSTCVGLLSSMCPHVFGQIKVMDKGPLTDVTLEWSLCQVCPAMRPEVGFHWEPPLANTTLERFLLGMSLGEMGPEADSVREMGATHITHIRGV